MIIRELKISKAANYQLVTFNDYPTPVETFPATTNHTIFTDQVESVLFQGGGDGKERLFRGLLTLCQESPEVPLIVVTTDHGSHDLELEDEIKKCLEEKRATVIIAFHPYSFADIESLDAYTRLADTIVNSNGLPKTIEQMAKELEEEIVEHVRNNCDCDEDDLTT